MYTNLSCQVCALFKGRPAVGYDSLSALQPHSHDSSAFRDSYNIPPEKDFEKVWMKWIVLNRELNWATSCATKNHRLDNGDRVGVENRFPSGQTYQKPSQAIFDYHKTNPCLAILHLEMYLVLNFQCFVKYCNPPHNVLSSSSRVSAIKWDLPSLNSKQWQGAKQPSLWSSFCSQDSNISLVTSQRGLMVFYWLAVVVKSNQPHNGQPCWGDGNHSLEW